MLNRRILRIKAFKVIYEYAIKGNMSLDDALNEMNKSCEATRDLYLFMLSIIIPLTKLAKERIEAGKHKFNPTEEEMHPNERFANNLISTILESDPDFQKIIEKKKFSWDQYDILLRSILDSINSKDYFKTYMEKPETSIKDDAELFVKIFEEEFVDSEELEKLLEDMSIYWTDDLAYSLTYCCRSIMDIAKGHPWTLPNLYQSDEIKRQNLDANMDSDRDFAKKLVTLAFTGYEKYFKIVCESVPDWDSDRLFSADMALIALGMAEAQGFKEIPIKVTLNEYVEISKYYSSPKSRKFVNGLLDKMIKENNILNKTI